MRKSLLNIGCLLLLLVVSGCEKTFLEEDPKDEPVKNFEILWDHLDRKYALFPFKQVDWDSIHRVYRDKVHPDMSDEALFQVMDDMLFTLRDGHVNLISPFDVSRNWQWYLDHPENFDQSLLERQYLGPDHRITGPFRNTILQGNIGYVYYGSLASGFRPEHLTNLLRYMGSTKGLIFDIRNNGGGSTRSAERIVQRFADKERIVSKTFYKDGPAHDDYTDPIIKRIAPQGEVQYKKPIILLTNRSSYSAANDLAQWMSVFPHIRLMGDTTGGGGGIPIHGELPNGWRYRFSSTMTLSPDGDNIEAGVPPDIYEKTTEQDIANGKDVILEKALDLLDQ